MAIPTFQEIMLPILKLNSDGQMHSVKECVEHLEQEFQLTDEEKQERVPSGKQRTFYNRVTWALTHIKKAGLLESQGKRGNYRITEEGRKLLFENPQIINAKLLRGYASYRDFVNVEVQTTVHGRMFLP